MNKLDFNKEYTLVGVGCSHTQGCAFTLDFRSNNPNEIKWANDKIAEKFNVDCSRDYITNNLTWMAFLKNHLKVSKIINLGYGGFGTTTSIRSLQNLILNTPSLENFLIIIQLEYPYRDELFLNTSNYGYLYHCVKEYLISNDKAHLFSNEVKSLFAKYFYSDTFAFIDHLYQLYYMQITLEKLGANVRIFGQPWFDLDHIGINQQEIYKIHEAYDYYSQTGFEKDIQGPIPILDLFNKLNIIGTEGMSYILKDKGFKNPPTLHNDYGIDGDHHLSEVGNELVAEHLFQNLDNKRIFKIQEDSKLGWL